MDIKDILKRFWFVFLIAAIFVVFIGVYAVNTIQNQPVKITAKEENGSYLIYSIGDESLTADDLYDELKESYGVSTLYRKFDELVSDKAIETTSEMKDLAANQAAYFLQQYGEEEADAQMQSLGYGSSKDLDEYFLYAQKSQMLRADYLKAHYDEYVAPYVEENNPKIISHILIKVADITEEENEDGETVYTANPTEEEKAKLDEVVQALENGEDFAEVAKEYSEDGSASSGGLLGYFDDNNSTYVKSFKNEAMKVNEGETSEVFTSEYGYHIIYCNSQNVDEFYDYSEFLEAIYGDDVVLYNAPLLEKAEELGITIQDTELYEQLMSEISMEEE